MTPQEQRPGTPTGTNIERIMRLAKARKAQGISVKQPAPSPAPAVTEAQPAEGRPEAKVEVFPVGEGTGSDREVILKINGESTGIVWREAQGRDSFGKELKGLFYLSEITATGGSLRLPKGTRLSIDSHVYTHKNYLRITGGKGAEISLAELKYLKGLSLSISLSTPDDGDWQIDSPHFGKEGTANVNYLEGDIFSGEGVTKGRKDLSVTEALDFFKKSLGFKQQPAAAAAEAPSPTNLASAAKQIPVASSAKESLPAEPEPEAKVEVLPISGKEAKYYRKVKLSVNGEDTGIVWRQNKSLGNKLHKGQFFLETVTATEGNLSIPSGARFTIDILNKSVHITGGNNTQVSLADLQRLKGLGANIGLIVKDPEAQDYFDLLFEKEKGRANLMYREDLKFKTTKNLSVPEALALLEETLKQQPAAAAAEAPTPTNLAPPWRRVAEPAPTVPKKETLPAEAEPDAKVEAVLLSGEENNIVRKVHLKINREEAVGIWNHDKRNNEGEFSLDAITTTAGTLRLPKGTRLVIYGNNKGYPHTVHITGGGDAEIPAADLKKYKDLGYSIWFIYNDESYSWHNERKSYEEELGKANFRPNNRFSESQGGLSVSEALDRFEKALGQEPKIAKPTSPAAAEPEKKIPQAKERMKTPIDEIMSIKKGDLLKRVREALKANEDKDVVRLGVTPKQLAGLIRKIEWLDVPGWKPEDMRINRQTKVKIQDDGKLSIDGLSARLRDFGEYLRFSLRFSVENGKLKLDRDPKLSHTASFKKEFVDSLYDELKYNPRKLDRAIRRTIESYLQKKGVLNREVSGINIKDGQVVFDFTKRSALSPPKQEPAETLSSTVPAVKTEAEIQAEAEETAWLTALAGKEFQREEKKTELEAEIKRFRDNLSELGYSYEKEETWETWDKKPFIKFRDEEGDRITNNELAAALKLEYGYRSLESANDFLEYEVRMGKTRRTERKADRKEALAKLESYCRELEYTYETFTGAEGIPAISLHDKEGKCVTKYELGDKFGYTSFAAVNDFLKREPKDPAERAKRNAEEKTELERKRRELERNCAKLKYSHEIVRGVNGRLIIVILNEKRKQVSVREDGSGYGYFLYADATEFVKGKIAETEKK